MDLKSIKLFVDSDMDDGTKKNLILDVIAKDKNAIPYVMEMLYRERETAKDLILDSNLELSRALLVLKDENLKWNDKVIANPEWVAGEIIKHYKKWKNYVKCNFKIKELDE